MGRQRGRRKRSRAPDCRPEPPSRWTPASSTMLGVGVVGKFSSSRSGDPMDAVLLCLERCGFCVRLFPICRPCFRGQVYCAATCRSPARAAQAREARATHQRSAGGREDHRDRNRELRLRKRTALTASVMDHGSKEVAPVGRVCAPERPHAPMDGEREVEGRSADDVRTDDDPENAGILDERVFAPRQRRDVEGGVAATILAAATVRVAAARAGAPGPARCAACDRVGVVVSTWGRSVAARGEHGPRRRRGARPPRSPPAHRRSEQLG